MRNPTSLWLRQHQKYVDVCITVIKSKKPLWQCSISDVRNTLVTAYQIWQVFNFWPSDWLFLAAASIKSCAVFQIWPLMKRDSSHSQEQQVPDQKLKCWNHKMLMRCNYPILCHFAALFIYCKSWVAFLQGFLPINPSGRVNWVTFSFWE